MAHTCYISFKTEDASFKEAIQESDYVDIIDKSLNEPIDSEDEDYILQTIRSDYLSSSTVTIHLIGSYGAENRGWNEQRFIKRELQASLYNAEENTKNGILGIILPSMYETVYGGQYTCATCGGNHNLVRINDTTTIREFNYNYYIPNNKCSHSYEDRYCVLVPWNTFTDAPGKYVEQAYEKRSAPIAQETKVYP